MENPTCPSIPTPIKAIRLHCLECMGNSYLEVEKCSRPKCPLWSYRLGTNPRIQPMSDAKREKLAIALQNARAKKALKG